MKQRILAFSGSNYRPSTAHHLLDFIAGSFPDLTMEIFEDLPEIPPFNPGHSTENVPLPVSHLRDKIAEADGLLFVTPEYVFSLPGSLKNMIEWLVATTVLSGKPTAFLIAASSGKAAFQSLKTILTTLECVLPEKSTGLIPGAKGKIQADGSISDPSALTLIDQVIQSLSESISPTEKIPTKFLDL